VTNWNGRVEISAPNKRTSPQNILNNDESIDRRRAKRAREQTGGSDANDDALTPAFVACLERLSHRVDVADALERVIETAVRHAGEHVGEVLAGMVLGVDAFGAAHLLGKLKLLRIRVDADDACRSCNFASLSISQTNRLINYYCTHNKNFTRK
jgi:hypothetical protein